MQLDACIRTLDLNCTDGDTCRKRVIFECSNARHAAQYSALGKEHPSVEFIAESDFHEDLQAALSGFKHVLFMVDDNLCVRPFRLGQIISALTFEATAIGFSLRLGRNIERCYSQNDAAQKMPVATESPFPEGEGAEKRDERGGKILRFLWVGASYDFGYPLEVSSSIFRVSQIAPFLLSGEKIKNPNALEARIDAAKGRFTQSNPDLLCFELSAAFCNPLNVVQYDYPNRVRVDSATSVGALMERFELGYRFEVRGLAGFTPHGCHQEQELGFAPPRLNWENIRGLLELNYDGAAAEGVETIAPGALRCEIETRALKDDSLQSVLTALHLLNAAQTEASVSWLEALGTCHREKLHLQYCEFVKGLAAMKGHLTNTLKYSGEQSKTIVAQSETIAARDEAIIEQRRTIVAQGEMIAARDKAIVEQRETIVAMGEIIVARDETVAARDRTIVEQRGMIVAQGDAIVMLDAKIAAMDETIAARDEAIAARDGEIAARDQAIAGSNERLVAAQKRIGDEFRLRMTTLNELESARWQMARIREKPSVRFFEKIWSMYQPVRRALGTIGSETKRRRFAIVNYIRGWIRTAIGWRGPKLQAGGAIFDINERYQCLDGQFYFRGWVLLKTTHLATRVRAEAFAPGKYRSFPATIYARPDVSACFNAGQGAMESGFHMMVSPPCVRSSIALQYLCDGKWLTFAWFPAEKRVSAELPPIQAPWPKGSPLVSVVVPCYNYGKYLIEAVDSALAQTWRDLEVIVVDDGSDDADTIRILGELRTPRTRVIRQRNLKLPRARNAGIGAARGKYICCLDSDDRLEPTYVEKCLARIVIEGFDICGSWQRNFGTEDAVHRPANFSFMSLLESNRMINCAMFPRRLWEAVGGFDETMVDGDEGYADWEFWIRLASRGARATVIPEPLFLYRKHGPSMIDTTMEKHDAIVARIREKHSHIIPKLEARGPEINRWTELLGREKRAEKPRVLVCLPFLTVGGAEKILSQICLKLRDKGFHFIVITTEGTLPNQGDSAPWFEAATSEIFRLPDLLAPALWSRFIAYLIWSRQTDILWQAGSTFIYNLLPELKTLFPGLKVVDILFNEVGHTANNRKYDYLIDLHITEGQGIKSWLLARGESADRVRVIPNGVDLSSWQASKGGAIPFDTGGRRFIVGFFGRLSEEKGPDLFIEIAERLKNEKDILFIVGGHGRMEDSVRHQISEAGLEDSVKLLGFCTTRTHLACCDVLVVPSRQDGRPNVVMEAMAMGVPVVASRVGGMAELVLDGHSGFLCDAVDISQFAEAILKLFRDRELRERFEMNTQQRAREHFDISKTVDAFSDAFHEIVRQPSVARSLETTTA